MTISFIIPAYNASGTIVRALDSIVSLTLNPKDYEVIVVDDCSTDNTREIVATYATKHSQVRLICQPENHRQGAARNRGVLETMGEYIQFVDADDTIAEGILDAIAFAKQSQVDMLFCTSAWQDKQGNFIPRYYEIPSQIVMSGKQFAEQHYDVVCVGPWTYLWKRDFLRVTNIPFIEDRRMEDFDFVEKHLVAAGTIAYSAPVSYNYYINASSTVHTTKWDTVADWVHVCYRRWQFLETLEDALPMFRKKIEDQCRVFVSSSLSVRRISRLSPFDINKAFHRITPVSMAYIYEKGGWSVFSRLCMKHPWVIITLVMFIHPLASIGRYIVRTIRKLKH